MFIKTVLLQVSNVCEKQLNNFRKKILTFKHDVFKDVFKG